LLVAARAWFGRGVQLVAASASTAGGVGAAVKSLTDALMVLIPTVIKHPSTSTNPRKFLVVDGEEEVSLVEDSLPESKANSNAREYEVLYRSSHPLLLCIHPLMRRAYDLDVGGVGGVAGTVTVGSHRELCSKLWSLGLLSNGNPLHIIALTAVGYVCKMCSDLICVLCIPQLPGC
jgi:hypothetical protein